MNRETIIYPERYEIESWLERVKKRMLDWWSYEMDDDEFDKIVDYMSEVGIPLSWAFDIKTFADNYAVNGDFVYESDLRDEGLNKKARKKQCKEWRENALWHWKDSNGNRCFCLRF